MKTKILEIPKTYKNPARIEAEINHILSKYDLVFAHQVENPHSGKLVITLCVKEYAKDSDEIVKVKAFRKTRGKELEKDLNKFKSNNEETMQFFTQSLSRNTITTLIYYKTKKRGPKPTKNNSENNEETTTPTE